MCYNYRDRLKSKFYHGLAYIRYHIKLIMKMASLIALILLLLTPHSALARSYETGTLVKAVSTPGVYYIGSDGKKYGFPNGETFKSWYTDFSQVITISDQEFNSIPNGDTFVTVRPGTNLVKFKNSPKVYAVENGAVLRWLPNEQIAKDVYGPNWSKSVIEFSNNLLDSYRLGDEIKNTVNYLKDNVRALARAVDNELVERFLIVKTNFDQKRISDATYRPKLKSLYIDYTYPLEPSFTETWTVYRLNLPSKVPAIFLRPIATKSDAVITTNGTPVSTESGVLLKLNEGSNKIVTTVTDPNTGSSTPYTIIVYKEKTSTDDTLNNIRGNLPYRFVPDFHPLINDYEIRASYGQAFWEFTPQTQDSRATITVDGVPTLSGKATTVPLDPGENKVQIIVVAENGKDRKYNITINRDKFPILDATNLASLQLSLRDSASNLNFDPNSTIYHLRAQADELQVGITAIAKYRDAYVVINGEQTTDKFIRLSPGENQIEIFVQLADGLEKRYEINIYRNEL